MMLKSSFLFIPPVAPLLPLKALRIDRNRRSWEIAVRLTSRATAAMPETGSKMASSNVDIKRIEPLERFSSAVVHDRMVYLSGILSPTSDQDAGVQTSAVLRKIDDLLEQVGTDKSRVINATIWLAPGASLSDMNAAWDAWIDQSHMPARACTRAELVVDNAVVEIQVIAALPSRGGTVSTDAAAAAVGPYNQAIVTADGTVYVSGCIGLLPGSGEMAGTTVEEQTKQALSNLKAILSGAGCTPVNIVKTTILLDDMADFAAVNKIYESFFDGGRVPARSCFAAKQLPKDALVEIEAIASKPHF